MRADPDQFDDALSAKNDVERQEGPASYQTLSAEGSKTNHLDAKQRELIALAVAVSLRCDGCIAVHTTEARKLGATPEEISEALGVAISVNAGAALVYSARVFDAAEAVAA